jgi:SpoVK/Ycf46/Vps4 family AAA+-type ATPase
MDNIYNNINLPSKSVFDYRLIESKPLYLALHKTLPSILYYDGIDGEKAYHKFAEKYAANILKTHTYRWFEHKRKKYSFDRTVLVLDNNCIVEFNCDYCEIAHQENQPEFLEEMTKFLKLYKDRQKSLPQEINLIVKTTEGLELKSVDIKKTRLNLKLFYEDEFAEIDALVRKRLNKNNDKGIVLLHGLPGTGKTTYLRYLIGRLKKRVMFLSPDLAGSLTDPSFIQLLIDNPNTVIIIEDAENVIMDRKLSSTNTVSNLLNISDGLLADFLNVQLICTFNNSLTMVDSALMRKGRLIAKYEFGKLSVEKAQVLSNHFGFDKTITRPMTIAEIRNQQEQVFATEDRPVIGFRNRDVYTG